MQLPAHLREEQPDAVGQVKGGSLLAEDLVGALRRVGALTEAQVQEQADLIINAQQEQEGLVATICHHSDG